jgi:hemolysin D
MTDKGWLTADAIEFAPDIVKAQHAPPLRYRHYVLYALLALLAVMLVWAMFGKLDIVAVANGKLVPQSYLKVVQPSDGGIVKEILVKEGDIVAAGQVLMRMDTSVSVADRKVLDNDFQLKVLQLRRIDTELSDMPFARQPGDNPALFAQVEAQYRSHRLAYQDAIGTERAALLKAQHDLKSAMETEAKLKQTLPIYREQEKGWLKLAEEGFAGKLMVMDRTRSRIETEQELQAQAHNIESLKATIAQSNNRIAQITSNYQQQLHNERIEAESVHNKLDQELAKHTYKHDLLELRAPQAGRVKDLSTHTQGTVVQPGTILLNIVPQDEPLLAEVWVSNLDAGFVVTGQPVRVKLSAYPFQKYGVLDGVVHHLSADASDKNDNNKGSDPAKDGSPPDAGLNYRALVELKSSVLEAQGSQFRLTPGMQVSAEIVLGTRTVLEYLLSPIQKTVFEAARER